MGMLLNGPHSPFDRQYLVVRRRLGELNLQSEFITIANSNGNIGKMICMQNSFAEHTVLSVADNNPLLRDAVFANKSGCAEFLSVRIYGQFCMELVRAIW